MGSSLTISHICLPCLPGGRALSWPGGEGRRIVRWQSWRGVRVVRWQRGESGRVVKWQGERFLILFKGGVQRVSPRFFFLVLMLMNGTKEQYGFRIMLLGRRCGKNFLRSYAS